MTATAGSKILVADLPLIGGSAGNRWAKFPSGLMICWLQTVRTDVPVNTAYGSLYIGSWTWTYPAAFVDVPTVACTQFQSGSSAGWGTDSGEPTATLVNLRGLDAYPAAAGASVKIGAIAVGRWK